MYYRGGLKTDDVAAALSMSGGAVRTLLSRVRESLRTCVERRLLEEGVG
jgi:DNA-directed RNA polymerase specialized sigma24 family protein